MLLVSFRDTFLNNVYFCKVCFKFLLLSLQDDPGGQTAMCWAYERGHDNIVTLLNQHQARPTPLSPSALVAPQMDDTPITTTTTSDTTYFPLPSPRGKLRAITHEKLDVLHLRTVLPPELHLSLAQIEHLENIGSGSFGKVFKVSFYFLFIQWLSIYI